jgi:four helix bundle protein
MLPKDHIAANAIANQIIRSSTSIGANYRAACIAKSRADFINKLKIVEEEADETIYWLDLIEKTKLLYSEKIEEIRLKIKLILSIIVKAIKTSRENFTKIKK